MTVISVFIIVMLNLIMIVIYCKYSGMPYKSDKHSTNLRHYGFVVTYWSFAFLIKFSTAFITKISPDNIGK